MCDRVAIVQGGVASRRERSTRCSALGRPTGLLVRVADPDRAIAALGAEGVARPAHGDADQLRVDLPHDAGRAAQRAAGPARASTSPS